MQDRPTDNELIDAVAQFLNEEIAPVIIDSRLRFRLLIAANVLRIVQRELAAGEAPLVAEWQQLVALLRRPEQAPPATLSELRASLQQLNQELCAHIRAGEADSVEYEAIFAHVYSTVIEKLRVTNPRYLQENTANS